MPEMKPPSQRPAQLGYSGEMGWHWLLLDDDREVAGLLIPKPEPRHHQGVWELVGLDTLRADKEALEGAAMKQALHDIEQAGECYLLAHRVEELETAIRTLPCYRPGLPSCNELPKMPACPACAARALLEVPNA